MSEEVKTNVEAAAVEKLENEIARLSKDLADKEEENAKHMKWWLEERERCTDKIEIIHAFEVLIKNDILVLCKK